MSPWRAALLSAAALVAGCGPDAASFRIHVRWATSGSLTCPAGSCTAMPLGCDAVVSLRVVDANNPRVAYISKCMELPAAPNLCGLGRLELGDDTEVPATMVRVQVALWPREALGDAGCPSDVRFDPRGLPLLVDDEVPAIGGEALFAAGSADRVDVVLGCPDAEALAGEACVAGQPIAVGATVDDFSRRTSVTADTGEFLIVSVGEPVERIDGTGGSRWEIEPGKLTELRRESPNRLPQIWTGGVLATFTEVVCLEVLHRLEGWPTATCRTAPGLARSLDLAGGYVAPQQRTEILGALGLTEPPGEGLVLGRVVDGNGNALAGVALQPVPMASVTYLSADGRTVVPGAMVTTSSGLFVSRDAGPRTVWTVPTPAGTPTPQPAVGGRITGHLTVVELVVGTPDALE